MVFMIKYQTKKDAVDPHIRFMRSFFAEHSSDPTGEMVRKLVDRVSSGDFDDGSIKIEEWLECDAEEMKRQGIGVHKFSQT